MTSITRSAAWQALLKQSASARDLSLPRLLTEDPHRTRDFTLELPGLGIDYSRNLITREILTNLLKLAHAADVAGWRTRLFKGETVNHTEQRAALHTLLRTPEKAAPANLKAEAREVAETLDKMRTFAEDVRGGQLRGASGEHFTDVIHIGIGGSHLGPELVVEALMPAGGTPLRVHFLSNVDPMHVARVLAPLDPARTLVVIASKTFTTQETLANAQTVRAWLVAKLGEAAVVKHFVAVSAAPDKTRQFGIPAERVFAFRDWVGGRYSLWSAVGLPIMLALGPQAFDDLLRGAARMDRHFLEAPFERNAPVLLALLGVWYVNFLGAQSRAVIPYRHSLRFLPAYLQQLEMESNGKRVRRGGEAVDYATAPVIWGDVGTNSQHAFFQLLHQGTVPVPVDFIAVLSEESGNGRQQDMLLANCFAQAEALAWGQSEADARKQLAQTGTKEAALDLLAKHKTFPGNRPSTLILLDRLDAETLGSLIALYEHRTFVQACVWDLNPFDQMGVELGKQLAGGVLKALETGDCAALSDPATRAAVERARRTR